MFALRTLVFLSLIGVAVPSFATESLPADAPAAVVPVLASTVWQILAYRSDGDLLPLERRPPEDAQPRLSFSDSQVSGNVGCNTFSGAYSLDGDRLTIDPKMAMTMMACEEPLMVLEQAVTAHLAAVSSYRRTGARMELLDAEGATLLLLEEVGETPLVGVPWRLERYDNGSSTLAPPLPGTEITLLLTPEGRVSGSDGCNRYMSGYSVRDGHLTFRQSATTRMACRNAAVAEQAAAYAAVLGSVRKYRIEGKELLLIGVDGRIAARFRAVPEPVRPAASR
jgi:heat shock protein HslJ